MCIRDRDKVTGSELAKMLLTGLGYKADIEGYTGASWELNVLSDATDAGLLDNYGTGYGVAAPRQWVALMTYNMLYSTCVKYDRDGNIQDEERTAIVGSEDIPVKVPMTGAYKFFGLINYKAVSYTHLDVYKRQGYYAAQGKLKTVDGTGSVSEITGRISAVLGI